ncbi:MAG: DEAD/DEAH box helicase [Bacteroidia bacterium]|nr:DEAD/DEAH box helicase [Bacteroidia bacterium]
MEQQDILKNLNRTRAEFSKLEPQEQMLLLTLALSGEPMAASQTIGLFEGLLKSAKSLQKEVTKLTKFSTLMEGLLQKFWINKYNKGYFIQEGMETVVIQECMKNRWFDTFLEAFRKENPLEGKYIFFGAGRRYPLLRETRISYLRGDNEGIEKYLPLMRELEGKVAGMSGQVNDLFFKPFLVEEFLRLQTRLQFLILERYLVLSLLNLDPAVDIGLVLNELISKSDDPAIQNFCYETGIFLELLKGDMHAAEKFAESWSKMAWGPGALGLVEFFKGNYPKAVSLFDQGLQDLRKITGQRTIYYPLWTGIFYILTLVKSKDLTQLEFVKAILKKQNGVSGSLGGIYSFLNALPYVVINDFDPAQKLLGAARSFEKPLDTLFHNLCRHWGNLPIPEIDKGRLESAYQFARDGDYKWLQMEYAGLISTLKNESIAYKTEFEDLQQKMGILSLQNLIEKDEEWKEILRALTYLGQNNKNGISKAESRLVWYFDFISKQVYPYEQRMGKNGAWSGGRKVGLKRIRDREIDGMLPQDHKVAATAVEEIRSYYGTDLHLNYDVALEALVGHPYLFLCDTNDVHCEFVLGEPEMVISEVEGRIELKFPADKKGAGLVVTRETPTRFKLTKFNQTHLRIAEIFGKKSVTLPKEAKKELAKVVEGISGLVNVHADLKDLGQNIKKVKLNKGLYVHLLPIGDGFRLEFLQKPLGAEGPVYRPGQGGESVISNLKGTPVQTSRNLGEEVSLAQGIIQKCPELRRLDNGNFLWEIDDAEQCLQVLLEIQPLKESKEIQLEWPEGEKLKVGQQVSFEQLKLRVSKKRDWFGLSGELQLPGGKIIEIQELLKRLQTAKGRFVEISDGQFIALTLEFQKKLGEAEGFLRSNKSGLEFHPLAALSLQDLVGKAGEFLGDKNWKDQIRHIEKARDLKPVVPSTLKAELREYQQEGFAWLSRLAHWGVGACLADDMGLGKTMQALALILTRAEKGPTLVVAPSSVTRNWAAEVSKFAPTLKPVIFGLGDRKALMAGLGPFDILLTSYGLMQQEVELMASVPWETIVLDEAQAIKNVTTKRFKSAMQLDGKFKIIASGTPVENHLGELWALFQFINPGFLGTYEDFSSRFAIPIEKNDDKARRRQLQALIKPFILRRRKSQVLEELPPKTEISLQVEMSEDEAALYEIHRRQAVEALETGADNGLPQNLQILAEIMRLRRLCCNPRLVVPNSPIESSKLKVFGKLVEELVENGHKVLVFSQFVGHLELIQEKLRELKLTWQYLDGSTPPAKRQEAINAFQAGKGDVFLISLKAGGTGLNLTAADYVIHMDPWWNPAVEDQASDRAHRIGQQRPVTIYRLIMENTIEEKIVKLHADKRDLADSLLEGPDSSAKLSAKELLALIKEI